MRQAVLEGEAIVVVAMVTRENFIGGMALTVGDLESCLETNRNFQSLTSRRDRMQKE